MMTFRVDDLDVLLAGLAAAGVRSFLSAAKTQTGGSLGLQMPKGIA